MKRLLLTMVLASVTASAQMGPPGGGRGGPGGRRGSPGGMQGARGMTPPRPIRRAELDRVVRSMFQAADADRDGRVSIVELDGVVTARRAAVVRDRFRGIDRDRSGSIDLGEFTAWQTQMGSVADSDAASRGPGGLVAEEIRPELGVDRDGRILGRIVEPLSATTIVNADADHDGYATLDELQSYERTRFDALDADRDGSLPIDELRPAAEQGATRAPRPAAE